MSNKTRKRFWPVSLVMSIAIVGTLAAFLVLAANPGASEAHPGDEAAHQAHCATLGPVDKAVHDGINGPNDIDCADLTPTPSPTPEPMAGTVMPNMMNASMPYRFWLEALDNGARLDWEKPMMVADGGTVVGYRIERDAWNSMADHPINMYGDSTNDQIGSATDRSDLGLAYETVYTYRALAIVDLDAETWWNNLDCPMMNDVVSPMAGEPQVGSDDPTATPRSPYCAMYDDLSAAAMTVVRRAHAGLEGKYPDMGHYVPNTDGYADKAYGRYQLGAWTYKRTIETADSGGRLEALLDPPSAVRNLMANPACADMVTVSWDAPMDFGTVPTTDQNGVYVGPDYIGGQVAGLEEVGEDATSVTYQIQRRINGGAWSTGTYQDGTSYVDDSVNYGHTYTYRVRARNGANLYSDWMMVSENLTEPPTPLRPSSLVVNLEEDQQAFELQWDPPADEADPKLWRTMSDIDDNYQSESLTYVIQWQVGESSDWETIVRQPHQYSRSGLNTVLTQEFIHSAATDSDFSLSAIRDKVVRYRVAAEVDLCNASAWNQADEVEVPAATEPGMPTGLTATSHGDHIDLSWTAPMDDGGSAITGYTFEYSTDGGSTWSDPAATDGMTSHSHHGVMAGTTYTYRVTAMNDVGSSMASMTASATTATAPPPPMLGTPSITATSNAAGSATIMLTPASHATKHFVWAFRVGGTDNATDGMWSGEAAGDATSVTMTGLTSGESYWFIAIAGRGDGDATEWSGWSSWTAPVSIQ